MVENANQGENDLDIKQAGRLSYMINTLLLSFVIIMMLLFVKFEATFLVYFSIPTILVYIINYILIHKSKLVMFVWLVYFWIALYMGATTVCLGYGTGFHLYVISLIPVCFYMEYMSYKLQGNKIRAGFISIILVIFYIVSSGFALIKGAVYPIVEAAQVSFVTVNALIVFSFIIGYTALLNKIVIKSENELKDIALSDRLTGLYNRHYMIEQINSYINGEHKSTWLAMADLDKFKEINDMFGHNAGDYVLVQAGNKMRDICKNCTISRWGGEEYLILCDDEAVGKDVLEKLRSSLCERPIEFNEMSIPVSITIGVADFENGMTMDNWVQKADSKLYEGKNNGRNIVVW